MTRAFLKYIEENGLFKKDSKLIVAVSGGIDSVVLLDLLVKGGYKNLAVAHCNFNLRGDESDADEKFVVSIANNYGVPVYVRKFDTASYAAANKLSIQMAARRLRYEWFEELRKELSYDYIVVGHNKNDVVETVLYNLSRGTGLRGLAGIKPKNEAVVRPLLFAGRTEIKQYASDNGLEYREDSSNASVKYKRNYIRHRVIPELEKVSPNFIDAVYMTTKNVREYAALLDFLVEKTVDEFVSISETGDLFIDKSFFSYYGNFSPLVLWHLTSKYGCNPEVCRLVYQSVDNTGAFFVCGDYKISIGRNTVYVYKPYDGKSLYVINSPDDIPSGLPFDFSIKILDNTANFSLKKDNNIAYADFDKIKFPLVLRLWKSGDVFVPFGMRKQKKLSDFFVDIKLDAYFKEKAFVLENADGKIIWVVGYRLDNYFKINKKTTSIAIFFI